MHHLLGRRVGLLKVATLGQLTAAQLKNASNILDVISGMCLHASHLNSGESVTHTTHDNVGILAYEDELNRLLRPLPPHVVQARQKLSHMFHCVLPFDFTASKSSPEVIDTYRKLAHKADILQARTSPRRVRVCVRVRVCDVN
jgi:hypothetical protein